MFLLKLVTDECEHFMLERGWLMYFYVFRGERGHTHNRVIHIRVHQRSLVSVPDTLCFSGFKESSV